MNAPINQASEMDKRAFEAQVEWDRLFQQHPAAAQPAPAAQEGGSCARGALIGVPLSIVIYAIPIAAWLYTGSVWAGALACALELGAAAWVVWHGPAQPGKE